MSLNSIPNLYYEHPFFNINKKDGIDMLIPIMNIVFAETPGEDQRQRAEQEARTVRNLMAESRRYFKETTYNLANFRFKLVTVILDKPNRWEGNRPAVIEYNEEGELLNDLDSFPYEFDYTGYDIENVYQVKDEVYHRKYGPTATYNMMKAALEAFERDGAYPWDDDVTYEEWLDFGIPRDYNKAAPMFTSSSFTGGTVGVLTIDQGEDYPVGQPMLLRSSERDLELENHNIKSYIISNYTPSIFFHELGHMLVAVDYYNDDEHNDNEHGHLGRASIMSDKGLAHFDAYLKLRFGWLRPRIITPTDGELVVSLRPVYESRHNALLIYPDSTGHPDEFFLVEVRTPNGRDPYGRPLQYENPNLEGVFIYHVNTQDPSPSQPEVDVEGDTVISGENFTAFNATTNRTFGGNQTRFYDNQPSGLELTVLSDGNDTYRLRIRWHYARGCGEFDVLTNGNNFERLAYSQYWRNTWDQIVPGNFGGNEFTDLLFYDKRNGEAEFYATSGNGGYTRIGRRHTGWRDTWDKIIPGNFGANHQTGLLLYDKSKGEAQFYITIEGEMYRLGHMHQNWRKTWDQIVPGNFGSTGYTDLLFYDKAKGEAQFFITDGRGDMRNIGGIHNNWRKSWDIMISGKFDMNLSLLGGPSYGNYSDLMFYDRARGEAEFFRATGTGDMVKIATKRGWRRTWHSIVPITLSGTSLNGLLFYDQINGVIQIFQSKGIGAQFKHLKTVSNLRRSWDIVVPGRFQYNTKTGVLLYDDRTV